MKLSDSPIQPISFDGFSFFIKRDDLLDIDFNGNKARKFYHFLQQDFFNITKIVSYGSAQSNALYSLSVLAKIKNVKFEYYIDHISSFLKENPNGNYKKALQNGTKFIELNLGKEKNLENWIDEQKFDTSTIVIEEGGRVKESEFGISLLANEIKVWAKENSIKELNIFLPSGTGTTSLFLQKNSRFNVYTCPCVGDSHYLKKQFLSLEKDEKKHPKIIETKKKYHFGKLYYENFEIYNKLLKETNIEFDLLYDPIGWNTLLSTLKCNKIDSKIPIVYIHQGGINGNITMMERYKRKYL